MDNLDISIVTHILNYFPYYHCKRLTQSINNKAMNYYISHRKPFSNK